jgi:phosphatidate phosphatase PAH1
VNNYNKTSEKSEFVNIEDFDDVMKNQMSKFKKIESLDDLTVEDLLTKNYDEYQNNKKMIKKVESLDSLDLDFSFDEENLNKEPNQKIDESDDEELNQEELNLNEKKNKFDLKIKIENKNLENQEYLKGEFKKSLRPSSSELKTLNLKPGRNEIKFIVTSRIQGIKEIESNIYLWKHDSKIIVSDIDGTITKYFLS